MTTAAEMTAPLVTAKPEPETAAQPESAHPSDTSDTSSAADIPTTTAPVPETVAAAPFTEDVPPQPAVEPVAPPPPTTHFAQSPATDPFPQTAPADNPPVAEESLFDEPLAPASSADTSSTDVFSDLFGPGTLPVGSVPDVSAHPFDMESAQTRNPEDPLRHLPRGDANVSGPLRDPLDLLDSHEGEDVHNVFSDQTPSTLPSHDPLAPHRLDPVSEALRNKQDHDTQGWAARDHLREYGGYLRPARVQQPAPTSDEADGKPDTPRRK
jgi:FHA domain-containing protein